MRANVWSGCNTVQVENVPDPKILNDRDAIVKITSTAICGSDLPPASWAPSSARSPAAR